MTPRLSDLDREVPLEVVWDALEALRDGLTDCHGFMDEGERFISLDDVEHSVQGVIDEIVGDW